MAAPDDSALLERLKTDLASSYSIHRELQAGGMSRVFLAEDRTLHRRVVIKVLAPNLAADISTERFAREVQVASNLQQANIVPVLSAGTAAGLPYYVMPFVEGASLRALMQQTTPVDIDEAAAILKDVARALAYAHEHNVVHRDIKPDNILLSGGAAVVTDFGIAKAVAKAVLASRAESLTMEGQTMGTPAYMSPEQASSDNLDAASDVYSWGVTAYELLAGQHPFSTQVSTAALIRAHIAERPKNLATLRRDIPAALSSVVMSALEKEPKARPSTGRELYTLLSRSANGSNSLRTRLMWGVVAASAIIGLGSLLISQREPIPSIAVLPFVNIGGDSTQEYFSDGVTIEITEALAKIPNLRLASRTSSSAFKGRPHSDAPTIADQLGVMYLVEGQLLRSNGQLRLSAQLTDGRNGDVVWRNRYERNETDVFAVQEDVAQSIAAVLHLNVPDSRRLRTGTNSVVAYDLFMRGFAAHQGFYTEASLKRAMALYDSAIMVDSAYANPYVWMAWAWQNMADDFRPPSETNPKAYWFAKKAISIDSLNAMAEMSLVVGQWLSGRPFIERHVRRAVLLSPNDPSVLAFAAWTLASFDWNAAKVWADRAVRLESQSELIRGLAAWAYVMNGEFEKSLRLAAVAEYADAFSPPNHQAGGEALLGLSRHAEALEEFTLFASRYEDLGRSGMARALAGLGNRDSSLTLLRAMSSDAKSRYVSKDYIAAGYVALGMNETALDWLEGAERDKANYLRWLARAPTWRSLHGNPRYEAMVRRLGLRS